MSINIYPIENAFLFQMPVPNYTDVDMSFSYKDLHSLLDFTAMDKVSPYKFTEYMMPVMAKMVEYQLSSPQLQEFIRLVQLV
jgi:hypothetical protein